MNIADAQAIIRAGLEATPVLQYEAMVAMCYELRVSVKWAGLLCLLDLEYEEPQAWMDGDFGELPGIVVWGRDEYVYNYEANTPWLQDLVRTGTAKDQTWVDEYCWKNKAVALEAWNRREAWHAKAGERPVEKPAALIRWEIKGYEDKRTHTMFTLANPTIMNEEPMPEGFCGPNDPDLADMPPLMDDERQAVWDALCFFNRE